MVAIYEVCNHISHLDNSVTKGGINYYLFVNLLALSQLKIYHQYTVHLWHNCASASLPIATREPSIVLPLKVYKMLSLNCYNNNDNGWYSTSELVNCSNEGASQIKIKYYTFGSSNDLDLVYDLLI